MIESMKSNWILSHLTSSACWRGMSGDELIFCYGRKEERIKFIGRHMLSRTPREICRFSKAIGNVLASNRASNVAGAQKLQSRLCTYAEAIIWAWQRHVNEDWLWAQRQAAKSVCGGKAKRTTKYEIIFNDSRVVSSSQLEVAKQMTKSICRTHADSANCGLHAKGKTAKRRVNAEHCPRKKVRRLTMPRVNWLCAYALFYILWLCQSEICKLMGAHIVCME